MSINKLAIILFVLASSVELSFAATSCLSILDKQERVLTTSADKPYVVSGQTLSIYLKANCSIPKNPNNNPKPKAVIEGKRNGVTVDKIKIEYFYNSMRDYVIFFIDDFAFEYENRYQTAAFLKPIIFNDVRGNFKIKFSINKSYVGENANILDEIIFYVTSSASVTVNDDNNRGTVPNNDDNNRGTVPNNDDTTGPEFVSTRFVFTLAENQVGTVPVLTPEGHPGVVRTTGAGVRYTLAADGGGRFRIDASTGAVTHVGSGTRAGHYELTVRATDARGREAEAPVIVEVLSTAAVTRLNRVQRTVLPEAVRMATGSAFAAVSGRLEAGRTANRLRVAGYEVLNGAADGAGTFADGACGVADGCDEGGDKTSARGPTTFDLTQVLTGSEFTLPLSATGAGTAGGLTPVLWGAVDWTALSGSGTAPDWDGGMLNAHLGADVRLGEHLLVGVALSHARGSFDWTDQGDDQAMTGTYKSRLTSLMPYLGWTAHERLEMWAATTLGRAEITLDDVAAGKYDSAATAWSAGTGARGTLLADGPTALALKGEAWVSRWAADGTDPVAALEADVQRLRLALEGRHAWTLASGAVVAPSLEVGVRHDSGAGETGTGLELGGGVHWNDPIRGLTFQARARTLLGRGGYRQWGIAGLASLDPGADGLGLALSVAPAWGVADSGLARLWDEGMAGRPTATLRPNPRLEGRLGYGVSAPGTLGTITPYAGLSLAGTQAQTWRTGVRLNAGAKIDAHLETTWRETIGGAPDRGVILEVRLRF